MNTQNALASNIECDECGSTQIRSDRFGYYFCQACGLVLNLPMLEKNVGVIHKNRNGDLMHQSAVMNTAGTTIGSSYELKTYHKYKHLQHIQNILTQNSETKAYSIFSQIRAQLEIHLPLKDFIKAFKNYYPRLQKGSKARNIPLLCTSIVYILCKKNIINLSLKSVLEVYEIDIKDYYACVKAIHKIDPYCLKISLQRLLQTIGMIISRLKEEFNLPCKILPTVQFLLQHHRHQMGEKPEIIAASAVIIALKFHHIKHNISILKMCQQLDITASTVYGRLNNFNFDALKLEFHSQKTHDFPKSHVSPQSLPSWTLTT